MTYDEAKDLAAIIATADGGCKYCVDELVKLVSEKFAEFEWKVVDLERYPYIAVTVRPWYKGEQ